MLTVEELKQVLADEMDPDLLVEILEITTEELTEAFTDKLIENRYKFRDYEENYDGTEEGPCG